MGNYLYAPKKRDYFKPFIMSKYLFLLTLWVSLIYGCETPVDWEEPNVKWKGVVHTTGLNTFLDCCDPGRN